MANAIITGASQGIGKAIALKFAEQQINLALCARKIDALESLKQEILNQNPDIKIEIYSCDVSKKEDLITFAEKAKEDFEQINILVNNAGVFIPGEILKEDDGNLEFQMETNLYSAYHLSRLIVPQMAERGSGHVINMCSIASKIAYPNGGAYSISKFALLGFSKVLREEMKEKGVRVTSILPGATWSNSWAGVELPESRLMKAEDIAKVVYTAIDLSDSAVIEDITIRPQLGDL